MSTVIEKQKPTAIRFVRKDKWKKSIWLFKCLCGKEFETVISHVNSGQTSSCGCEKKRLFLKHRATGIKHALASTPEYKAWHSFMRRCFLNDHPQFHDYGGRGITVCERWKTVENFYSDMGPRPSSNSTLDRIDNEGNYCPENCRWTDMKVQGRNRRTNRFLEYKNECLCIADWADRFQIPYRNFYSRLQNYNFSIEKIVSRIEKLASRNSKTKEQN